MTQRTNDDLIGNFRKAVESMDYVNYVKDSSVHHIKVYLDEARAVLAAYDSQVMGLSRAREELHSSENIYSTLLAKANARASTIIKRWGDGKLKFEGDIPEQLIRDSEALTQRDDAFRSAHAALARVEAANARIAELESELEELESAGGAELDAANARADAAERNAKREDDHSTVLDTAYFALKDRAESEAASLRAETAKLRDERETYAAEVVDLRAEVERLRAEHSTNFAGEHKRSSALRNTRDTALSKLAAAESSLTEARAEVERVNERYNRVWRALDNPPVRYAPMIGAPNNYMGMSQQDEGAWCRCEDVKLIVALASVAQSSLVEARALLQTVADTDPGDEVGNLDQILAWLKANPEAKS